MRSRDILRPPLPPMSEQELRDVSMAVRQGRLYEEVMRTFRESGSVQPEPDDLSPFDARFQSAEKNIAAVRQSYERIADALEDAPPAISRVGDAGRRHQIGDYTVHPVGAGWGVYDLDGALLKSFRTEAGADHWAMAETASTVLPEPGKHVPYSYIHFRRAGVGVFHLGHFVFCAADRARAEAVAARLDTLDREFRPTSRSAFLYFMHEKAQGLYIEARGAAHHPFADKPRALDLGDAPSKALWTESNAKRALDI